MMHEQKTELEVKDVLPNKSARRQPKAPKNAVFVPDDLDLDLDLKTRPSEETRTSSKVCVNLAQIRSAVPEIFHAQTKKTHRLTTSKREVHYVR